MAAGRRLPPALRDVLEAEGANTFTAEMLERVAGGLPDFDTLAESEEFVVFFGPPSLDERIVNQAALFSLLAGTNARPYSRLERHLDLVRRIVVPADLKAEVRDKLDQANLTERVLFPGLDGLSAWLARYDGPRPTSG